MAKKPAKVALWSGFCTVSYWIKKNSRGLHIVLTAKAPPREDPEAAMEDARKLEDEQERYMKSQGVKPTTVRTGICPPDLLI